MKKIKAEIVADSINPQGDGLTTYLLTFPKFILAELNTHRVFSKNSASSRAIPFEKMVKMVKEDPFIPIAWQKDHKGMQGSEYAQYPDIEDFKVIWLEARDNAIKSAQLAQTGRVKLTKQLCNRLLEPFMWHTVLLTGTEFKNFFELRCPQYGNDEQGYFKSKKDALRHLQGRGVDITNLLKSTDIEWQKINKSQAEIHMQALAEAMWDAMNESTPKLLKEGEWHIPFGDKFDKREIDKFAWITNKERNLSPIDTEIAVASARCARLSYMTFDGEIDYEKDIKLHDSLLKSGHMSPFEHCARAMSNDEYYSFIKGKVPTQRDEYGILNYEYYPYSDGVTNRDGVLWMGFNGANPNNGDRFGWCNNFRGFVQYRYLIEHQ